MRGVSEKNEKLSIKSRICTNADLGEGSKSKPGKNICSGATLGDMIDRKFASPHFSNLYRSLKYFENLLEKSTSFVSSDDRGCKRIQQISPLRCNFGLLRASRYKFTSSQGYVPLKSFSGCLLLLSRHETPLNQHIGRLWQNRV